MKVIFVALCLVAGAFARSAVQSQQTFAEGPACPIDDPLLRDGPVPLNVTVHPIVNLEIGSELTDLKVDGLSSLHYKVDINVLLLTATFEVTITTVTGNATYKAEGYVDARPLRQETLPSGNMTGSGLGKVSATNVHLKGRATLFINLIGNKVGISILSFETISFDTLSIDFGADFTIGGIKPNWDELNANIKKNFDEDWASQKNAITEKLRVAANGVVGKYTLAELIDLIGGGEGGEDPEC